MHYLPIFIPVLFTYILPHQLESNKNEYLPQNRFILDFNSTSGHSSQQKSRL